MLAESKLNSIDTLISQALVDMEKKVTKSLLQFWKRKVNVREWKTI